MATISTYSGSVVYQGAPGVRLEAMAPKLGPRVTSGVPLFIGFVRARLEAADATGLLSATVFRPDSWEAFEHRIDPVIPGSFLRYAVRGFFQNGGERCVVFPLPVREPDPALLAQALRELFGNERYGRDDQERRVGLDDIDDADLVCVPDIMIASSPESPQTVFELQERVLAYCDAMGERLAILDVPPVDAAGSEAATKASIEHWEELSAGAGALYFPWVRVKSLHGPDEEWVPPCGHVAGIYARSDARVGVHKAPANEIVEGILDIRIDVTSEVQDQLNDAGVNCLRSFPRRGIRVWGARTLSGQRPWRYVNVRRTFLTLVHRIKHDMNDLTFEPNTPLLWDRVLERLRGFCYELFERGALKGTTPEEGFFLKCDAETNPLEERDAGRVVCEIGLALGAPAEFIVLRMTRTVEGTFTAVPTAV
jgi:hypothetical protein